MNNSIEVEVEVLPKIIIDYPNPTKLAQLYSLMQYVLVDDNYKTLHQPFYCKDYFNEIIATEYDGESRVEYGFVSEKFPFDILKQDSFKLALLFESKAKDLKEIDYINKLVNLLNQVELKRGYKLSFVEETEDSKQIVLNSDIKWMSTPVYMSFFCLLIRLAYNYIINEDFRAFIQRFKAIDSSLFINRDEKYSFNEAEEFMFYLFNGGTIEQTWEQYLEEDTDVLHNNIGMVSYYNYNISDIDNLIENGVNNS